MCCLPAAPSLSDPVTGYGKPISRKGALKNSLYLSQLILSQPTALFLMASAEETRGGLLSERPLIFLALTSEPDPPTWRRSRVPAESRRHQDTSSGCWCFKEEKLILDCNMQFVHLYFFVGRLWVIGCSLLAALLLI